MIRNGVDTQMDYPQNLSESDLHWYDLIQQCRASGKSDRQWLAENSISPPTFYYHVKQLRKKACAIPEKAVASAEVQEVVPLIITDDLASCENHAAVSEATAQPDTLAIRLVIHGVTVEITNQATQSLIQNTVSALRYLC